MDDYIAKPVRLEDIRGIIERWGSLAAASHTTDKPQNALLPPETEPAAKAAPAEEEDAPVDMARLLDFTDGTAENLRELVMLYLDQTTEQLAKLQAAVDSRNAPEVRRIAHSCAGASATCGMRHLVPLLRELERQGFENKLTTAPELSARAGQEFACIRSYLENYLAKNAELAANS
jgi:HPt (histidine-containing phosphotransfer) domain-containing protein